MGYEKENGNESKQKSQWILIVLLLLPLIVSVIRYLYLSNNGTIQPMKAYSSPAESLEEWIAESLPFSRTMKMLSLDFSYFAGHKEQDGVFISEQRLMKNLSTIDSKAVDANFRAIEQFTESLEPRQMPYFMIVPTATGVLRQKIPAYTQPVNQRNSIDNTYNQMTEIIPTIDVYNTLLHNQDKYIYYRTEDNITPVGGYYIYCNLVERMLGETPPHRNTFDVVYGEYQYYGNLYKIAPYHKVEPDVLLQYHFPSPREYLITQETNGTLRRYHSLYPFIPGEKGQSMEMYLGGLGDVTQILSSSGTGKKRLLLLGDHTALSYVPFLANHYKEIVIIDISKEKFRANFSTKGYEHVLIACSAETYLTQETLANALEHLMSIA